MTNEELVKEVRAERVPVTSAVARKLWNGASLHDRSRVLVRFAGLPRRLMNYQWAGLSPAIRERVRVAFHEALTEPDAELASAVPGSFPHDGGR